MSSFRVCPTDKPGVTRMEFDYYHVEESTSEKFEEYFKFGTFVRTAHTTLRPSCPYIWNGICLIYPMIPPVCLADCHINLSAPNRYHSRY
jgi:hypothetical protein